MVIIIPGELTDLNEYIRQERGNKYVAAKTKLKETDYVALLARQQAKPIKSERRLYIFITWSCKDQRKDPDNVAFAKKFILDGLVVAGVLEGDGWKIIGGLVDSFRVDKDNPRVVVEIC